MEDKLNRRKSSDPFNIGGELAKLIRDASMENIIDPAQEQEERHIVKQLTRSLTSDSSESVLDEKQKVSAIQAFARFILETLGFMRERNRPLVTMYVFLSPPLKKLETKKTVVTPDSPESKKEVNLNVQANTQANTKLFQRLELRTPKEAVQKIYVPCGLQSFFLLSRLKARDPLFNVKVPMTFVLNCGFKKNPMQVYNDDAGDLIFTPVEGARNLKELALTHLREQVTPGGVPVPVAVLKFNKGRKLMKWIMMGVKDLNNQWPEFDTDSVIQQYMAPKGLQASKTRVILKDEVLSVYKWTSNVRMDSKSDYRPHKPRKKADSLCSSQTLEFTVLNHRRILRAIEAESFEEVSSSSLNKSMLLINDTEAKHIFDLFKSSPTQQKSTLPQTQVESTLTARYTTHNDPKKSEVHKCNPGSYEVISSQTKKLKSLIERIWLKYKAKIGEIVVDFVQGASGEWYFLGIKRVVLAQKAPSQCASKPVRFSKCEGTYCKLPEDKLVVTLSQHSQAEVLLSKLGCKEFYEVSEFINRSQQLHKIPKKLLGTYKAITDPMNVHSYDVALVCTLCYHLYSSQEKEESGEKQRLPSVLRGTGTQSYGLLPERKTVTKSFLGH